MHKKIVIGSFFERGHYNSDRNNQIASVPNVNGLNYFHDSTC